MHEIMGESLERIQIMTYLGEQELLKHLDRIADATEEISGAEFWLQDIASNIQIIADLLKALQVANAQEAKAEDKES